MIINSYYIFRHIPIVFTKIPYSYARRLLIRDAVNTIYKIKNVPLDRGQTSVLQKRGQTAGHA